MHLWPGEWLNVLLTTRVKKQGMCAGLGLWLVVMGGRTADMGWFRTKTDTFLNDVVVMDRYGYTMKHLHVLPAMMLAVLDSHSLQASAFALSNGVSLGQQISIFVLAHA